jgi:hypothetical protein
MFIYVCIYVFMCVYVNTDIVVIWVGRLVSEKRPDIWLNTVKRHLFITICIHTFSITMCMYLWIFLTFLYFFCE